jgi:hypothetical protein
VDPQSRKLGRIISHIYNEIYDMGDDALDYLNDRAAVWAELWDRYEGDIDSIIAEEDPVTLGQAALELKDILNDLQSDQGLAEGSQRVDSLVTDALKIMRGPESTDAIQALKTVLGDREFSSRRGFYNFYIRQLVDMYGQQGVAEGEVVPFKRPQPQALTWKQLPKDVLVLANDWYWADQDNSGVDALLDPDGFGNGTANELKYITAKLQQRGWNIDYNDEHDAPGEFNLKLTNNRGQTVLLSIEDAQDFTGWAQGTDSMSEEKVRLDPKCWKGKKIGNPKTKIKGGVRVNNCVPAESVEEGVAEGSEEKDPIWNKGTPMPKHYTCPCGIHVHPSIRNPKAIHDPGCPYAKKQGVAEGSEFGAYYYEQLAQQTFDINPNLTDENEILNLGYKIAKGELGSRAQGMFRDEDFPSDFVSAYGYLKKQGVAEGTDINNLVNVDSATGKLKGREAFVRRSDPRLPLDNKTEFLRGVIFDRENVYGIVPGTGSRYKYWLKDESGRDFSAPSRDVFVTKESVAEEEQEANYGKKYQDMVKRMGAKAREQEQSRPVDIGALARKLRDIEQSQAQDKK